MHLGKSGRIMDKHYKRDAEEIIENLNELNGRFSGKRILLAGAAGFLGSQFIHYFLSLNDRKVLAAPCTLLALDNYMRGVPKWLKSHGDRTDIILENRDIITAQEFKSPDFIIHAASIASPLFYRQHPIETMDANVIGLRNILDYSAVNPVESVLFFSSSEIYGDPDPTNIPTKETYRGYVSCTGPRACYDESKRYGETLCVNFYKIHQVPIKITRPFNNYGPGLRLADCRVIPDFFSDILADRDIRLLSDGLSTRTFCYVSDAVNGYLRMLLSDENGEAFNIGTEAPEISMRDLASLIIKVSGKPLKVVFKKSEDVDYITDNPKRRCPCIDKARRILGYNPSVSLEAGLERTYRYYLDHCDD